MSPAACVRMASRTRRRIRFLSTELPTFLVTVMPKRGKPWSPRSRTSSRNRGPRRFVPARTARNSLRFLSRPGVFGPAFSAKSPYPWSLGELGRQALAATRATGGENLAATVGRHAGTEAMTALADEFGGLIGALHLFEYRGVRPFFILLDNRSVMTARHTWGTPDSRPSVRGL
jgi:hypothetical protein